MKDSDAILPSPEVAAFVEAMRQADAIAPLTRIVEEAVQAQLHGYLEQFQQTVAQSNADVIKLMLQELNRAKSEGETVQEVMHRLKTITTPDLPSDDSGVLNLRQAIDNLETYGSIIPSSKEVLAARIRLEKNHAWSLFWQSVVRLVICKVEKILNGNRTIS